MVMKQGLPFRSPEAVAAFVGQQIHLKLSKYRSAKQQACKSSFA
jgi:hypothetical protein